jgi:hypothetical protein
MQILERGSRLGTFMVILAGLIFAPFAIADDEDDVLAIVYQYGNLEGDLEAQSKLMRADRVYITGGFRQTDEAKNMAIQMAVRKAGEAAAGGKIKFISTIEGPVVRVYGNVAVASFVRVFNTFPPNQPANPPGTPTWVTLVLVKDGGKWGIAHTHQSPTAGN